MSLRIFVVIHLIVGSGGALWLGIPAYRQQAAIRGLERSNVAFDIHWVGPGWLRQWLGNERMKMFDKVVGVSLAGDGVTDGDLAHLGGLPDLHSVNLSGSQFTDEGLKYLGRLTELNSLNLWNTQVTDAGLIHLTGLDNLKYLYVGRTSITKGGIASWKRTRSRTAWPVYVIGNDDRDQSLRQAAMTRPTGNTMSSISALTSEE